MHNGASGGSGGNKGKKGCDFRGGKKKDRDNWYGEDKNYPGLKDWWHRTGKKETGMDLEDHNTVLEAARVFCECYGGSRK